MPARRKIRWVLLGPPVLLVVSLLGSHPALAATANDLRSILRVQRGASCLREEQLAAEVEQWLYDEPPQVDVAIIVVGSSVDARSVRLRVVREGRTLAHRAFEPGPERCDHLHAAVGLSIALILRASLMDELGQPLPDDPAARERDDSLWVAVAINHDLLPGISPGLQLGAELALGRHAAIRFGALGTATMRREFERKLAGFDGGIIAARSDLCTRARATSSLRWGACAGLLGGVLYVTGVDVARAKSSTVVWMAFANTIGLDFELSERWSLGLELSLLFPLRQVRIGIDDARGAEVDGVSLARLASVLSIGPAYHY